jgi:hypothetical protein
MPTAFSLSIVLIAQRYNEKRAAPALKALLLFLTRRALAAAGLFSDPGRSLSATRRSNGPGGTYTVQGYIDFRSEVLMYWYGFRAEPTLGAQPQRQEQKQEAYSGKVSSDHQPDAKRLALAAQLLAGQVSHGIGRRL